MLKLNHKKLNNVLYSFLFVSRLYIAKIDDSRVKKDNLMSIKI